MTRFLPALALLGCTALAGCGTEQRGLESVHQPVVTRTDYVFDMAAPGPELAETQARALGAWFDSLQLRYGDRVSVDTQGFGPQARDAVATVAARYGLLTDETAPVTQGDIPAGSVRVIVSRMAATVPGCPDFTRPATANFTGSAMSNYGCATNATLAAMIADPRDLISGRTPSRSSDVATSTKAITAYRKAVNTGTEGLKTQSSRGN